MGREGAYEGSKEVVGVNIDQLHKCALALLFQVHGVKCGDLELSQVKDDIEDTIDMIKDAAEDS